MAEYITTDTELTSVADAIRAKGGTSAALTYPDGFVSAIEAIPTGGGASVTTVTFGEYASAQAGIFTTYVDGDGNVQRLTSGGWGRGSEDSVDMMSGSCLVTLNDLDFIMAGMWTDISGLTLVYSGTFSAGPRTTVYYRIYQVD